MLIVTVLSSGQSINLQPPFTVTSSVGLIIHVVRLIRIVDDDAPAVMFVYTRESDVAPNGGNGVRISYSYAAACITCKQKLCYMTVNSLLVIFAQFHGKHRIQVPAD